MMFSLLLFLGGLAAPRNVLPGVVSRCVAQHPEVKLDSSQSPPYLRVRFLERGRGTLIVAVVYREVAKSRVLVCPAEGTSLILGEPAGPKFSDMDGDDYMASRWRVCSKEQVVALKKFYKDVPTPENEAVCLTWEDGEALIYSSRGRYMWKSLTP